MRFKNPYKRLKEIEEELKPLEVIEKADFIGINKRKIEEIKSSIFFLTIEEITIKDCIQYFEKLLKKQIEELK